MTSRTETAGLAATAAATATGLAMFALDGLLLPPLAFLAIFSLVAFPIALLHSAVLGAPLYFLLIRHCPLRWWNAGLVGFGIGAIPVGLLALLTGSLDEAGQVALWGGGCGLVGGLVFRAVRGGDPGSDDASGQAL